MTSALKALPVTFGRVSSSELVKFRTLPAYAISTIVALAILAAFGFLASYARVLQMADDPASAVLMPSAALVGIQGTQILLALVAVMFITSEFAQGTIQPTLFASPRRLPVLAAKATILCATGFLVGVVGTSVALFGASLVADIGGLAFDLTAGLAVQMIVGAGCYLGMVCVLALGVATIIRNTVGALLMVVGLLTVAPLLLGAVPLEWIQQFTAYLPTTAGLIVLQPAGFSPLFSPWTGLMIATAWAVCAFFAACITIRKTDA